MSNAEELKRDLEIDKLRLEIHNMPYVAKVYQLKLAGTIIAALAIGKYFL